MESEVANKEDSLLFPPYWPCREIKYVEVPEQTLWPKVKGVDEPCTFTYASLPSSSSIRLVHLQPGHGDDPIRCRLSVVNLDDGVDTTPPYEALSYVWGYKWEQARIFVDDIAFKVTFNLFGALHRLRSPTTPRTVWVDAICINQYDPTECSAQVRIMSSIYRRATGVVVWLGPKDPEDEAAVDFINELSSPSLTTSDGDSQSRLHHSLQKAMHAVKAAKAKVRLRRARRCEDPNADPPPLSDMPDSKWHLLFRFFELPYFCRTWIIQEVQSNARCTVLCGARTTTFDAVEHAARAALQAGSAVRDLMITDRGVSNALYIRRLARGGTSLMTRLEQTKGFFATDVRDKVFAFVRSGEDSVAVDYTMSSRDVFVKAAEQMLSEDGLDALAYVRCFQNMWPFVSGRIKFPSWVPTFAESFVVPLSKIPGFAAAGCPTAGMPVADLRVEDDGRLKVKGALVDRVAIVYPEMRWEHFSIPATGEIGLPTYVDWLWKKYAGDDSAAREYPYAARAADDGLPCRYSMRAAFAMTLTAGLGRWGLGAEVASHEAAFAEFSRQLFGEARPFATRQENDEWQEDWEPRLSDAFDLVGTSVTTVNRNGGGLTTYGSSGVDELRPSWTAEPEFRRFQRAVQSACNQRCVFQTEKGHLGLGRPYFGEMDEPRWNEKEGRYPEKHLTDKEIYEVWVLGGGKVPYILRPHGDSYLFGGECYVQGIMEGEAVRSTSVEWRDIYLC